MAAIFDIYRGTTHDGPGLRTTFFFKGCPLKCAWCHNPEGISLIPELWWDKRLCIGCLDCIKACQNGALEISEGSLLPTGKNDDYQDSGGGGIFIDRIKCVRCGKCTEMCPSGALKLNGRKISVDMLVHEALKYREYYETGQGGVTASGGEPLVQFNEVAEFFSQLKYEKIHTALDTCGYAPYEHFAKVLTYTDIVLFDLKIINKDLHRRITGVPNELILNTARMCAEENKAGLWIRTPLIPGATADSDNIASIANFIKTELSGKVLRWELVAFNNVCRLKYDKMRQPWPYATIPLLKRHEAAALLNVACRCGFPRDRIFITGLTSS